MKWSNIPQPVAARLLELDQRVADLTTEAEHAERVLENARAIINFQREDVTKAEYALVRERFDGTYKNATQARQRADQEQGILSGIKVWIEMLPHNTKLCMVQSPADGDLATLQHQLQGLRAELTRLQHITIPDEDIAKRVRAYVQSLANQAQPLPRGYGPGQTLAVHWPDVNALSLSALLQPEALAKVITNAVAATMPMSRDELKTRLAALPNQIDELSYSVASLLDREDQPLDPAMSPWHQLGVRIKEEEKAVLMHV